MRNAYKRKPAAAAGDRRIMADSVVDIYVTRKDTYSSLGFPGIAIGGCIDI